MNKLLQWLDKLAIKYLRKRKLSVFMNFETRGGFIQQTGEHAYYYDLELTNTSLLQYETAEELVLSDTKVSNHNIK